MPLHQIYVDIDKPEGYRMFCDALEQDRLFINEKFYILSSNPPEDTKKEDISKFD